MIGFSKASLAASAVSLFGILVVLLVVANEGHTATATESTSQTRAAMREIFDALTAAYVPSLDIQRFQAPESRAEVYEALKVLAKNGEKLAEHGVGLDHSYLFLRRAFAFDTEDLLEAYRIGSYESAQFYLRELTQTCFACHSRMPSERSFDFGKQFFEQAETQGLPALDAARLAVASRQFDAALRNYETLFRSTDWDTGEMYAVGAFEDYLIVALRVENDFDRAIKTLEAFRDRPDTPRYLKTYVDGWVQSLREIQAQEIVSDDLGAARELMRQAQLRSLFPEDPKGLVHFIAVSAHLHRFIASNAEDPVKRAEAYFLLGVAESRITRSYWLSETTFFLENAIRLNPKSPMAKQAYAYLEEDILLGYTGSSGMHVPDDVQEYLQSIRMLMEE